MVIVLIDTFSVPEESKEAFLESARKVQNFTRTLLGFVEGFLFEKKGGESRNNFLTTAIWTDENAFEEAGSAVSAEFGKQGINLQKVRSKLKIESTRSVYGRSPYQGGKTKGNGLNGRAGFALRQEAQHGMITNCEMCPAITTLHCGDIV